MEHLVVVVMALAALALLAMGVLEVLDMLLVAAVAVLAQPMLAHLLAMGLAVDLAFQQAALVVAAVLEKIPLATELVQVEQAVLLYLE